MAKKTRKKSPKVEQELESQLLNDYEIKPEQKPSKKKFRILVWITLLIAGIQSRLGLSERQKNILAASLTVILVGVFFYVVSFGNPFTNRSDNSGLQNSPLLNDAQFQKEIQDLENIANQLDTESIIYIKLKYEDLDVYPSGWVERNFTAAEIRNSLISGPEGDADKDGLTNKQEFLFASNPKLAYSLCTPQEQETCPQLNDKQAVDTGISPLTGLPLEQNREIVLQRQDNTLLSSIEDSFDTASEEGVDFPSLYQLSRGIDLTEEQSAIEVRLIDNSRTNLISYLELRIEVLKEVLEQGELQDQLASLLQIYSFSKAEQLEAEKTKYEGIVNKLKNASVPENYKTTHQTYILLFSKLQELVEHRLNGVQNNLLEQPDFQQKSKQLSTEVVWSYREISEIVATN